MGRPKSIKSKGSNKTRNSRKENSLAVLTKIFLNRIRTSPNNVVDLNDLTKTIKVQKRRIYDITNVLEGIGYITKYDKNKLKLSNTPQYTKLENDLTVLEQKLEELNKEEIKLEKENKIIENEINNILNNEEYMKYCYLNEDDIKNISVKNNLKQPFIIVQAPKNTKIDIISEKNENDNEEANYPHKIVMENNQNFEDIKLYFAYNNEINKENN